MTTQTQKLRCLDIGSGPYPYHGEENEHWEHLDGAGGPDVDYLALAYPLHMFSDCTFDKVRASHILEHFHWSQTVDVLREWIRILKPGGTINIAVPNMEQFARKIIEGGMNDGIASQIYARNTSFWDVHRAGFDVGLLEEKFAQSGLKNFRVWASGDGIHSEGIKDQFINDDTIRGEIQGGNRWNDPIKISRNDAGRVGSVEGRSFCVINTRGWGDILASLALCRRLKEQGASWVGLGAYVESDDSLLRANESCDYIFRVAREFIINQMGAWCYENADYVIDQRHYKDSENSTFYEQRILDVFDTCDGDVRPTLELAGHVDEAVKSMCKEWGIPDKGYFVIHPQSAWPSRTMTKGDLGRVIRSVNAPCITVGYDLDFDPDWPAINYGQRNAMDIVAGLIRNSKGFVGVDSIWSHVAFAYDVPSFVFYSAAPSKKRLAKHFSRLKWADCEFPDGMLNVGDLGQLDSWRDGMENE